MVEENKVFGEGWSFSQDFGDIRRVGGLKKKKKFINLNLSINKINILTINIYR